MAMIERHRGDAARRVEIRPPELLQAEEFAESSFQTVAGVLRRNLWLIAGSIVVVVASAAVATFLMRPVYEARATIRVDEAPSRLSALDGGSVSGKGRLATELEVLQGRQLLNDVLDSVGYRLRVRRPWTALRTEILSNVRITGTPEFSELTLVRMGAGDFSLVQQNGDTVVRGLQAGRVAELPGVEFRLEPAAKQFDRIELEIEARKEALARLEENVDARRRSRDADLIDLSVTDRDPEYARLIAETHARLFILGRQGGRQLEARETVHFLTEQVERAAEQLTEAEQALRTFRERQRIVNLQEEVSSGVVRRGELQAMRSRLDAERMAFETLLNRAGDSTITVSADNYRHLLAFPTLVQSGIANDVITALGAAEERRNELLLRRTANDPDVMLVEERISELHGRIQTLASTYFQGLRNQIAAYDALLVRSNAQLASVPATELRLTELEREARGAGEIYAMLQGRLKEAEIAAAATDQSIRLVDPAAPFDDPVSPKPVLNLALALLCGAMLGLAGTFVRENLDGALRTRRELLFVTGVPVFGIVPRVAHQRSVRRVLRRSGRTRTSLVPGVAQTAPSDRTLLPGNGAIGAPKPDAGELAVFAAAHARLAANISFLPSEQRPRVLAITSALPGDGKTTVSVNLALALSRAGQRVLLVDADLRGGKVASMLQLSERSGGLADVLGEHISGPDAVLTVSLAGGETLDVVVAGRTGQANPAQLLSSTRALDFMKWARSAYDIVIVDTPPVVSVSDAAMLVPMLDGVMVVARSGTTPREALALAMEQLQIVSAPVVGAVLNDVDIHRDALYDSAYRYYGTEYTGDHESDRVKA